MADRIKGITIELNGDTTGLSKALKGVNSTIKGTQRELNDVEKLLKFDPHNTELLAQRQQLLANQVGAVSDKLKALKAAEAQAQAQFARGEISEEQYRALQREIIDTTHQLDELTKKQREANGELKDGAEAADKAGKAEKEEGKQAEESAEKHGHLGTALAATGAAFAAIGAAAVKATKALVDSAVGGAEFADAVLTESTVTGIATDKLQGYMYAAELVDVSTETLTKSMAKNIKSMTSAASGTGAAAEAYAALGVSVTDAEGNLRDSETVYWELIDALGNVEDETTRDSLSMQILGRSAQDLNPLIEAGASRMQELGQQAADAGYIMSGEALNAFGELDDQLQYLNVGATAAKNALGTVLLPVLTDLATDGVDLLGQFTNGILDANGDISKIGDVISDILPQALDAVNQYIPVIVDVSETLIDSVLDALLENSPAIIDSISTILDNGIDVITNMAPQVLESVLKLATQAGKAIIKSAPTLIKAALDTIKQLVKEISANADQIIDTVIDVVLEVAESIGDNASELIRAAADAVSQIAQSLLKPNNIRKLVDATINVIAEVAKAILQNLGVILDAVASVISGVAESVFVLFNSGAAEAAAANEEFRRSCERTTAAISDMKTGYEEMQKERAKEVSGIRDTYAEYQTLAGELDTIVDANGVIKEGYEDRADYIIGELSSALDIEISRNGDLIESYGEVSASIDELIRKKQAMALLESNEDEYAAALDSRAEAYTNLAEAETELEEGRRQLIVAQANFEANKDNLVWRGDAKKKLEEAQQNYTALSQAVNDAQAVVDNNVRTIQAYEDAQVALANGEYDTVTELMDNSSAYYYKTLDASHKFTQSEISDIKSIYTSKSAELDNYQKQLAKGVSGYTKEGLAELEGFIAEFTSVYISALDAEKNNAIAAAAGLHSGLTAELTDAASDAFKLGGDFAEGYAEGMKDKYATVMTWAKKLAQDASSTLQNTQQSASPSKVTEGLGEDFADGYTLGINNRTIEAAEAAASLVDAASMAASAPAQPMQTTNNNSTSIGGITLVVNGSNVDNVDSLADLVSDRLYAQLAGQRAVYA